MVCAPQFRGHENLRALHDAFREGAFDALADLGLVSVTLGCVDVAIAYFEGMVDGCADFTGRGLPCSCKY